MEQVRRVDLGVKWNEDNEQQKGETVDGRTDVRTYYEWMSLYERDRTAEHNRTESAA